MVQVLHIVAVLLTAVAVSLSLAHALEYPGKLSFRKKTIGRSRRPGFTIGSFGEVGAILANFLLVLLTPSGSFAFWLVLIAFLSLLAMHAVYWIVTHPVNRYWVKGEKLGQLGAGFFAFGASPGEGAASKWTELRDRWEYSHIARAGLAFLSLILLVVALAL